MSPHTVSINCLQVLFWLKSVSSGGFRAMIGHRAAIFRQTGVGVPELTGRAFREIRTTREVRFVPSLAVRPLLLSTMWGPHRYRRPWRLRCVFSRPWRLRGASSRPVVRPSSVPYWTAKSERLAFACYRKHDHYHHCPHHHHHRHCFHIIPILITIIIFIIINIHTKVLIRLIIIFIIILGGSAS
jgi:hypothetical protein